MTDPASDRITLYTNPFSRGRIAHWMLEEAGAPYGIELVDLERGEHKTPEFLKVNPMGKVPAIVHRGVVITETSAICAYVADAFPAAKLAPDVRDVARGAYYRWLFFSAGCLEYAFVDRVLGRPEVTNRSTLGYGSYEDTMSTLERALSPGPWLLGETFTAADVHVASALVWALRMNKVESRPAFDAYLDRCLSRPAYKRMEEQCGSLIEQLRAARKAPAG